MPAACRAESAILAQAQLEALAKELERTHPGAAAGRALAAPTMRKTPGRVSAGQGPLSLCRGDRI